MRYIVPIINLDVAQVVERLFREQEAVSSSLTIQTKISNKGDKKKCYYENRLDYDQICVCSLMDKNSGLLLRKMRVRLPSGVPNLSLCSSGGRVLG